MYIDTHCHISKEDYDNIDMIIKENLNNGVNKMIISGCTRETINESIELIDKYPSLYATIGYHPSEASITTEDDLKKLEDQIKHIKVVGIGEIGLDYHYGKEDKEQQIILFRKQLDIASRYNMPVVIHSRDATLDTINILKEYKVVGDMHCFSGSVETARIYISMGYKLGIGGVVTFKNSNLADVVKEVGIDNILLETDAPYLTPEPYRGKLNSSKYIPLIAEKVAGILNIEVKEVEEKTTVNAHSLFDLK